MANFNYYAARMEAKSAWREFWLARDNRSDDRMRAALKRYEVVYKLGVTVNGHSPQVMVDALNES